MIRTTNLRDSYKYYKRHSSNPLECKTYLKIVGGFIAFVMRKVFEGFDVQLSGGRSLGTIGIRGKKMQPKIDENGNITGLPTDWKSTNELWEKDPSAKERKERIYFLNEHSNGIKYNFRWWNTGMKIGNKMLYSLVFAKPNRRKLTKLIKEGKEYLVN